MRKETSNPAFRLSDWELEKQAIRSKPMTENGTLQKTFLLFLLMATTFFFTAKSLTEAGTGFSLYTYVLLTVVVLIVVIIACTVPKTAPILAPIYAILEGCLLGSAITYSNYILEAFVITATIFFTLLFLYRTRIIRVTKGFVKLIIGLTFGILVFYLLELTLILTGITDGSLVFGNGIVGLLIAAFCLFVAASNLLVDFFMIEEGADQHLPKYMEWFFGMSLLISIVWVYVEVLRILNILSSDE